MNQAPSDRDPFAPFSVSLNVIIRRCRPEDLPTLEWFGMFADQRELFQSVFAWQQRGQAVMLVAEANGVASGQTWIDFSWRDVDSTGVIWAVRVFPALQRLGIGSRLIAAAERILLMEGFEHAELTVDHSNPKARQFYEARGYRVVKPVRQRADSPQSPGVPVRQPIDQWILRKRLTRDGRAIAAA